METKNCKICMRLFNTICGQKICPSCNAMLEDKFKEVKEYILNNKNITINIIAKEFNIPNAQIKQWIKEERLIFSEDSIGGIECEGCGKYIKTGRFCNHCKISLVNQLNNRKDTYNITKDRKSENKMRFLHKND